MMKTEMCLETREKVSGGKIECKNLRARVLTELECTEVMQQEPNTVTEQQKALAFYTGRCAESVMKL